MKKPINQVKERPIALTEDEVRAVLEGCKTQHRILIEPSEEYGAVVFLNYGSGWGAYHSEDGESEFFDDDDEVKPYLCPFGSVGDRLWVQESYALCNCMDITPSCKPHYFTDGPLNLDVRHDAGLLTTHDAKDMPRWASRLLLEITNVRVERVQDIQESDAKAMGLKPDYCDHARMTCEEVGCYGIWPSALEACLRNKYGHKWWMDVWFWVIDFEVVGGVQ